MYDFEIDTRTREMLSRVSKLKMASGPERMIALKESVEYVVRNNIPGDIVECGVCSGASMMFAAMTLMGLGEQRILWLYDTFEGMPPPGPEDRHWSGQSADVRKGAWEASFDEVWSNMASTGYNMKYCAFVAGLVEETIPNEAPDSIAILRLDTDWYSSTRHELIHLFPRLSRGGVLIVDDYGHWLGAKKATDEFIADLDEPLMLHRIDYTARIAIRQGCVGR